MLNVDENLITGCVDDIDWSQVFTKQNMSKVVHLPYGSFLCSHGTCELSTSKNVYGVNEPIKDVHDK